MRAGNRLLAWTATLLVGGCATLSPPAGYVKLRNPRPYDVKAVSARGNVIALTARSNESPDADLQFWSEAVEYQKVTLGGMKLAAREPIRSQRGLDGTLFHFEVGEGRGKITYLVGLYVTPYRIYTVEASGPAAAISEDFDKLRTSILSLRRSAF